MSSGNKHINWAIDRIASVRLLYNSKNNIAFYYIPKSGCTSIRHFLENNGGCIEKDFNDLLSNVKLFAMIRDPLKRLVSGYMTRRTSFYTQTHGILPINYPQSDVDGPYSYENFISFINNIIKINQDQINVHFTPQYILINKEIPKYIYNIDQINELTDTMHSFGLNGEFPHDHNCANAISADIYNKLLNDSGLLEKIKTYYYLDYQYLSKYF